MTGFLRNDELESVIRQAKAVIIPSELYENYPYSCLEAMAYGKPVIGSRIGGIIEQVDEGETGFLFEPSNDKDLADKMILLNSLTSQRIMEMGRKARSKVEKMNHPADYLQRLLDLYHDVIIENSNSLSNLD